MQATILAVGDCPLRPGRERLPLAAWPHVTAPTGGLVERSCPYRRPTHRHRAKLRTMRLGTHLECVGSSPKVSGACHDDTREFAGRRSRLAERLSGIAEKLAESWKGKRRLYCRRPRFQAAGDSCTAQVDGSTVAAQESGQQVAVGLLRLAVELPIPCFLGSFRRLHCRRWRLYCSYSDFSDTFEF
ncbi:hypothetical protein GW17_00040728 [Ensete ventricosum]|nr:hypothetical protein GW17_00040728 [Ensete ventricosum]